MGGRLSFRHADVVPFTFDLDFPEGLRCRESTVDESGGNTVPAVEMKNIRKGTREELREGVKIGTGKGGGGGVNQRFYCQEHYGPSTKKAVRERD